MEFSKNLGTFSIKPEVYPVNLRSLWYPHNGTIPVHHLFNQQLFDNKVNKTQNTCGTWQTSLDFSTKKKTEKNQKTRDRRKHSPFSHSQRLRLENEFKKSKYLNYSNKAEIAKSLNLTEKQVGNWFKNRRVKNKKKMNEATVSSSSSDKSEDTIVTEIKKEHVLIRILSYLKNQPRVRHEYCNDPKIQV